VGRFASGRKGSEIIAVRGYDRTTKQFMYDTIFDLTRDIAGERDVPAIHPIISTSQKRENVHAIA